MRPIDRRRFLAGLGRTGAMLAAGSIGGCRPDRGCNRRHMIAPAVIAAADANSIGDNLTG